MPVARAWRPPSNAVSELLTTEELTNLNLLIADQQSFEDIADQWLSDNGLK